MAKPAKRQKRDIQEVFDRFFEEPFRNFMLNRLPEFGGLGSLEITMPKADMYDKGDTITVKMEVPGIDKEKIDISISDGFLNVKGEVSEEEETEEDNYYYSERSYGRFSRKLKLPSEIKNDKVSAKYKDGILEINLPKTEKSKPKEIKVQVK